MRGKHQPFCSVQALTYWTRDPPTLGRTIRFTRSIDSNANPHGHTKSNV